MSPRSRSRPRDRRRVPRVRLLRDGEDVFYADATDHNLTAKLRLAMGAMDPMWPVTVPLALDGVDRLTR